MIHSWARPHVDEMRLYLFPRFVHPEFFSSAVHRRVERAEFTLDVLLTSVGHLMTWRHGCSILTEVIASRKQELPQGRSLLRRRFLGEQRGRHALADGFNYHVSNQLEVLPREVFIHLHGEMLRDGPKKGLFHSFEISPECGMAPLSWISIEGCRDTLCVNTCHTFPDECTLLKTQSLIERR